MYHHRIVNQRLDTGHRQILLFLTGKSPGYVDGCEGHVEVECESLFLTRLAVGESCVLLAVSQEELNLEPCPVDVHNVLCRHIDVCGEEHLPGLGLLARLHAVDDDNTYIALQAYSSDDSRVECSLLAVTLLIGYLLKVVHAEIIQVHLAVHLLRSAFLASLRPKVEILQADVTAEAAYQVEAQHGDTAQKRLLLEEGIGSYQVADLQQGILLISINYGYVDNLQSILGRSGTARPEVSYSWCVLAALVYVARINGQSYAMPFHVRRAAPVVAHLVELPLEVLTEAALAGVSEARHLHEIDAFWYAQIKNHCLMKKV